MAGQRLRVLVVTHDLTDLNSHLMPWRTVCEVVGRAVDHGCEARLLSLGSRKGPLSGVGIPAETISIPKRRAELEQELHAITRDWPCDVIVWPLVWREPAWRTRMVAALKIPLVGYLPGGVYHLRDVYYAARSIGIRHALPYIVEALYPKTAQLRLWKAAGFARLIAMTEYTARVAIARRWDAGHVKAILPGREVGADEHSHDELPTEFTSWCDGRPFFLFAGPPSRIRGVFELLDAFDAAARKNSDVSLVLLFRSDAPLDAEKIRRHIENMNARYRIYVIWKSVTKSVFDGFVSKSHGVVLPFVSVPSEVPLAIIESMRYGKPIITTMTGGTGDFVRQFGVSVRLGDIDGMADIMLRLLSDRDYYQNLCDATLKAYMHHVTWDEMVEQWCHFISGSVTEAGSTIA